jgi:hypothetical protein
MASPQRREPSAVAVASARLFETLSRARRKRAFHPDGVGFAATLEPLGAEEVSGSALGRESEAVVRLSRALGLPEWLPDPCGLALRVPDAYGRGRHQDLLLVSSGSAPLARHAISPARGFFDRPYSTVLPYRLEGRLVVFAALPEPGSGQGPKLAELRRRDGAGLAFELALASPGGAWQRFARLALGERLDPAETERLDFDPTNTGGGLELAGFLNRLRGPSYRSSQAGREEAYREGARDGPDASGVSRGASAA